MDIVDLTDSPAAVPDKGKAKKRQTEGSSPQPKKRKSSGQPDGLSQQTKKIRSPKAKAEKRTDAAGRTVRFASAPSQKVKERIIRAMPGINEFAQQRCSHFTDAQYQLLQCSWFQGLGCIRTALSFVQDQGTGCF